MEAMARESDGCAPYTTCIRPNTLSRPTPASEYRCAPPCLHGPPNPPPPCTQSITRIAANGRSHRLHAGPVHGLCARPDILRLTSGGNHADQRVHGDRSRATAIRPLVSLSNLCTIPAQAPGCTGIAPTTRLSGVRSVAGRRMHHKTRRIFHRSKCSPRFYHRRESARVGTLDSCSVGRISNATTSPALTRRTRGLDIGLPLSATSPCPNCCR